MKNCPLGNILLRYWQKIGFQSIKCPTRPELDFFGIFHFECAKLMEKIYEAVEDKKFLHLQDTSSVCEVLSNLAGQSLLGDQTH